MILSRGYPRRFPTEQFAICSILSLHLSCAVGECARDVSRASFHARRQEDVLLGRRRSSGRPSKPPQLAIRVRPAPASSARIVARLELPVDEHRRGARRPRASARAVDGLVVERRRAAAASVEAIALRICGRAAGRRVAERVSAPSAGRAAAFARPRNRAFGGEGVEGEPAAGHQRARDAARRSAARSRRSPGAGCCGTRATANANRGRERRARADRARSSSARAAPRGRQAARRAPPRAPASRARGRARRRCGRRAAAAPSDARCRSRDPGPVRRARRRACR